MDEPIDIRDVLVRARASLGRDLLQQEHRQLERELDVLIELFQPSPIMNKE